MLDKKLPTTHTFYKDLKYNLFDAKYFLVEKKNSTLRVVLFLNNFGTYLKSNVWPRFKTFGLFSRFLHTNF